MDRKGATPLLAIAGIILIVLILYFGVMAARECNRDSECPSNNYCGVDHECHELQVVQTEKQGLIIPALILAVAIIVAAYILRKKRYSYI